ncbi:hypothetical protein Sste5346_008984 [Sporothrix stenoceras]|uniref:CBM-cenC domain-containing protein n=1 Tax=Sporothrix stenoceras TaxID=5173 RepID=A0ABR3YLW8_9PEZI
MRLLLFVYLAAVSVGTATATRCRPSHSVSSVSVPSSSSSTAPTPSGCVPNNILPGGDNFDPTDYTTSDYYMSGVTFNANCGDGYSKCATMVYPWDFGTFRITIQQPVKLGASYTFSVAVRVNQAPTASKLYLFGDAGLIETEADLGTFTVGEYQVVSLSGVHKQMAGFGDTYVQVYMPLDEPIDITFAGFSLIEECEEGSLGSD